MDMVISQTPTQHGYKAQQSQHYPRLTTSSQRSSPFNQIAPPVRTITVALDMTYEQSFRHCQHIDNHFLLLVTSGCLAVVYSAWSAIVALHLSVIVFSLDLELRLLHSFGTIGESSIEHR